MQFGEGKPERCVLQREHPLAQGLVGAWAMDDGAGKIVRDHARTNHGTAQADGKWVPGRFGGRAMTVNGTTDYVSVPSAPSLIITGDMTIAIVFQQSTQNASRTTLIGCYRQPGPDYEALALVQIFGTGEGADSQKVHFFHRNALLLSDSIKSTGTITTGALHSLVVTIAGNAVSFYLDGTVCGSGVLANARSVVGTNGLTMMALQPDNVQFVNGCLENSHIYNRALSAAEIAAIYRDPFALYRPPKVQWSLVVTAAWWQRVMIRDRRSGVR